MATTASKSLSEHLQEQQKPFVLDIYLSERRKMLNKNPYRPCSCNLKKRRILCTKKILKFVLYKFTRRSRSHKVSSGRLADNHQPLSKTIGKPQKKGGTNRFPKVSMTKFPASLKCIVKGLPCSSQALKLDSLNEKEVVTDKNHQRGCKGDNEQLSPVSVLSEVSQLSKVFRHLPRGEAASPSRITLTKSSEEEAFLWEFLIKSVIENQSHSGLGELMKIFGTSFPHNLENKMVLQQSKQLLFDCVNEAIEAHERKNATNYALQEFMGLQELGNIICQQIYSWGAPKAGKQINNDVLSAKEDGEYVKQLCRKIGIEIGDTIMDEMIQEVLDLFTR